MFSRNEIPRVAVAAALAFTIALPLGVSKISAQQTTRVRVQPVDKAGFDKVIASQRGKIVVVDCWATWCTPCLKQFPQTMELVQKNAAQGVILVSLNFDDIEDGAVPAAVDEYLTGKGASKATNLMSTLPLDGAGGKAYGVPDQALPHYLFFGRDGKLAKTLASSEESPVTHEKVAETLQSLLKEQPRR